MEENANEKMAISNRLFTFVKKSKWSLIGMVLGALGGFIYYRTVGCSTGSCPITSNPWMSLLWGAVMGYLLGSMIPQNKTK